MRCFVAIELPAPIRAELLQFVRSVSPKCRDVRWCNESQFHVTLKFLGELTDERVRRACEIARESAAGIGPFSLETSGWGAFPNERSPRVLWLGAEDAAGACLGWLQAAEPRFEDIGVPRETRPFTTHVTVARAKSPVGNRGLRDVLAEAATMPRRTFEVRELTVFESRLERSGARYSAIARIAL
ncbi:MAG: RNA 2',3'-cyclic phosphodiesterase [Planctomycetes bacterium]|nr:RNA 2',3'-cyclic phosphodiesterase [Planctomycetota bacterium]